MFILTVRRSFANEFPYTLYHECGPRQYEVRGEDIGKVSADGLQFYSKYTSQIIYILNFVHISLVGSSLHKFPRNSIDTQFLNFLAFPVTYTIPSYYRSTCCFCHVYELKHHSQLALINTQCNYNIPNEFTIKTTSELEKFNQYVNFFI